MRLLRRRIDLARCGAWLVVTSGPPRERGAAMATQITPQVIKLKNMSVSTSTSAWATRIRESGRRALLPDYQSTLLKPSSVLECPGCERESSACHGGAGPPTGPVFLCPWLFGRAEARTGSSQSHHHHRHQQPPPSSSSVPYATPHHPAPSPPGFVVLLFARILASNGPARSPSLALSRSRMRARSRPPLLAPWHHGRRQ